jgi:hypothetical protein
LSNTLSLCVREAHTNHVDNAGTLLIQLATARNGKSQKLKLNGGRNSDSGRVSFEVIMAVALRLALVGFDAMWSGRNASEWPAATVFMVPRIMFFKKWQTSARIYGVTHKTTTIYKIPL